MDYKDLATKFNVSPDRIIEIGYDLGHEIDAIPAISADIEAEIATVLSAAANSDSKTESPGPQLLTDDSRNSKQFVAATPDQTVAPAASSETDIENMPTPQIPTSATFWGAHQHQQSPTQSLEADIAKMRGKLRAYELDRLESQALVEAEINILQLQPMPGLWPEFDGAVNQSCEALKNSEPKVRSTAEKAGKDWEKVELRLQKQKDFLSQLLT